MIGGLEGILKAQQVQVVKLHSRILFYTRREDKDDNFEANRPILGSWQWQLLCQKKRVSSFTRKFGEFSHCSRITSQASISPQGTPFAVRRALSGRSQQCLYHASEWKKLTFLLRKMAIMIIQTNQIAISARVCKFLLARSILFDVGTHEWKSWNLVHPATENGTRSDKALQENPPLVPRSLKPHQPLCFWSPNTGKRQWDVGWNKIRIWLGRTDHRYSTTQ